MTSAITGSTNNPSFLDNSRLKPEVIYSYTKERVCDVISCSAVITGHARGQIITNVRRDATEGSLLVRKMNSNALQFSTSQQTTIDTGHPKQLGEIKKSININVAADKFLLGTMGALAYNEDEENILMASRIDELGSCRASTSFMDVGSSTKFLCITPKTDGVSGDKNTGEIVCSPQKKVKQNSCPSRPPLLPPCRVCGDRASGYHYGVNTCEACKGFFRRSICKAEPYVCAGTGDCKTVAGKRTACSHCRFKRCITVGMSKTAIKTGRYTHELRSKNILEVKRLQKQNSDECPDQSSLDSSTYSDASYTEYKNDLLRKTMLENTLGTLLSGQKMLYEFLDDYYNDDLIKERQMSVYRNYMERKRKILAQRETLPVNSVAHNIETQRENTLNKIESNITEQYDSSRTQSSSHISKTEVNTLQKAHNGQICRTEVIAAPPSVLLSSPSLNKDTGKNDLNLNSHQPLNLTTQKNSAESGVNNDKGNKCSKAIVTETGIDKTRINSDNAVLPGMESLRAEVMTKIINDLEQGVQGMLAFAKSLPGFSDLPSKDQVSLVKAARFDIWYIGHIRCFNVELRVGACEWQFHADELAQVWGEPMVDLAFTLSRVAKTLNLTKQETAALRAVCLTFPDRCIDLQNRKEVEQMHDHMLEVFKYVSCKTHASYNKWFTKIINFLVLLREFGVKFEAVSSKLTLDWSVLKDNPVLLSVFLS